MFLSVCSPTSSKAMSSRSRTSSCTRPETQMPPGVGDLLQARRDVDAVAEDVVAVDDDVADVDADAEGDAAILGNVRSLRPPSPSAPRSRSARHRPRWRTPAAAPSPVVLTMRPPCSRSPDRRTSRRSALQRRQRAALVAAHQPRVARHVGRHDGGKAALLAGHSGPPKSHCVPCTLGIGSPTGNENRR